MNQQRNQTNRNFKKTKFHSNTHVEQIFSTIVFSYIEIKRIKEMIVSKPLFQEHLGSHWKEKNWFEYNDNLSYPILFCSKFTY